MLTVHSRLLHRSKSGESSQAEVQEFVNLLKIQKLGLIIQHYDNEILAA